MMPVAATEPPSAAARSTKQTMFRFAKHGLAFAILVLMPIGMAAILAPLPAMADPRDVNAGQEAAGSQESATDSTQENNGFDITRPQPSFEVRGIDQESSNDIVYV